MSLNEFSRLRRSMDRLFDNFDRQMFGGMNDPFLRGFDMPIDMCGFHDPLLPLLTDTDMSGNINRMDPNAKLERERLTGQTGQKTDLTNTNQTQNQTQLTAPTDRSQSLSLWNRPDQLRMKMDIVEEKDRYVVSAEVPGIDKNDLKLSIDNGMLTVSGERKNELKEEDKDKKICTYGKILWTSTTIDTAPNQRRCIKCQCTLREWRVTYRFTKI